MTPWFIIIFHLFRLNLACIVVIVNTGPIIPEPVSIVLVGHTVLARAAIGLVGGPVGVGAPGGPVRPQPVALHI